MVTMKKKGTIKYKTLEIEVVIKKQKKCYGHLRYLVTPGKGKGEAWMNSENVK